jgi:hypothetical protein
VVVPYATIQNWVEAGGGKKAARRIDTEHLDWAFADSSGYIAADELYDGPFCILSIVATAPSGGSPIRSSTTTPPTSMSRPSSAAFGGRSRPAG